MQHEGERRGGSELASAPGRPLALTSGADPRVETTELFGHGSAGEGTLPATPPLKPKRAIRNGTRGCQAEDASAIARWGDEGGQHADAPGEGQVPAAQRWASTSASSSPRATALHKNLPPLMRAVQPIEHQFDALVLPWSWCSCCQRAFVKGTYRSRRSASTARDPHPQFVQLCPYQDCWGEIVRDSFPWASIRQAHAGYPEQPERYVIYAR